MKARQTDREEGRKEGRQGQFRIKKNPEVLHCWGCRHKQFQPRYHKLKKQFFIQSLIKLHWEIQINKYKNTNIKSKKGITEILLFAQTSCTVYPSGCACLSLSQTPPERKQKMKISHATAYKLNNKIMLPHVKHKTYKNKRPSFFLHDQQQLGDPPRHFQLPKKNKEYRKQIDAS